jgi:hypothetical protein
VNTEHLVNRVPEAVRRLLIELLSECVTASLGGAQAVNAKRVLTLYENNEDVRASLTITMDLNVSDS